VTTARTSTNGTTAWTVSVVRVVDGDTMDVRFADGHTDTIRLLGVDTPEVYAANRPSEFAGIPNTTKGRTWLRSWGHRASRFARERLAGERVRIALDPKADRRGSYDRLLVYVFVNGSLFNRQLLERGYARFYDAPLTRYHAFASAVRTARANHVGLWGYATTNDSSTMAVAAPRRIHTQTLYRGGSTVNPPSIPGGGDLP